ncbi:hypothetical protein [Stenomitos frigidus]
MSAAPCQHRADHCVDTYDASASRRWVETAAHSWLLTDSNP